MSLILNQGHLPVRLIHPRATLRAAAGICPGNQVPLVQPRCSLVLLGSPLPPPSPLPLARASSEKAPPILRGDCPLPHPTTGASANAAKAIESSQLFGARQGPRCSSQLPGSCGPSRDLPVGAVGMSFSSQRCCLSYLLCPNPVWSRLGTLFFSCFLISLSHSFTSPTPASSPVS